MCRGPERFDTPLTPVLTWVISPPDCKNARTASSIELEFSVGVVTLFFAFEDIGSLIYEETKVFLLLLVKPLMKSYELNSRQLDKHL